MTWRMDLPQGNESSKVKYDIVPFTRGRGLDLGCGPWKAFPHFIGVDNGAEWGGYNKRPDVVADCGNLDLFADASMDFVFSSHLLEHFEHPEKALAEWWRVIKPEGHLVLYLPHKEFYPNIGEEGANPSHHHDFLPSDVTEMMKRVGCWDLVLDEDRGDRDEYSFLQVYRKKKKGHRIIPKPEKTCAVTRFGGFGDMIQTSSVLPLLKAQGYHITLFTNPTGHDIMKTDPHVDAFVIQDKDQVPNEELAEFWASQKRRFDKWVNFSESVEGTWLALPGRTPRQWPDNVRKKYLNGNYLEFMHDLAGVEYTPRATFYPTLDEAQRAERFTKNKLVVWSLAGSSLHKFWPYQDQLIARILATYPGVEIALTGDGSCQILEYGWEEEKRVHCLSGKMPIRDGLALAQRADLVIGPETGVMNCVAFEEMPKILFLSHSSKENLSRDWVNTYSLEPEGCYCYPCHKLHYGWDECKQGETGAAVCQERIGVEKAWLAVQMALGEPDGN